MLYISTRTKIFSSTSEFKKKKNALFQSNGHCKKSSHTTERVPNAVLRYLEAKVELNMVHWAYCRGKETAPALE